MYFRQAFLISGLLSLWLSFGVVAAEVHIIEVKDHAFVTANGGPNLVISEGDTVKWVWRNDFHNVVAGTRSDPSSAFESQILNTGDVFEVVFDRFLLKQFPTTNSTYQYFCEPHVSMGMIGSIKVERRPKTFLANPTAWQVVPPTASTLTLQCSTLLSADESTLSISCPSQLFDRVELRRGVVGTNGEVVCAVKGSVGHCSLEDTATDALYFGELYLNLPSPTFIEGELRGQLFQDGGINSIFGEVLDQGGQAVEEVEVSAGANSAKTDKTGHYTIANVPNGVYTLSAAKALLHLIPVVGVNHVLVNNSDVFFQDFVASPNLTALKNLKLIDHALSLLKENKNSPTRQDLRRALRHVKKLLVNEDVPTLTAVSKAEILLNLKAALSATSPKGYKQNLKKARLELKAVKSATTRY